MLNITRFRKIRWFFAKVFLHILWWDILLNRPVLSIFRTPAMPRWQRIARLYRSLAVEMGGVLIKLGQFLSIRVDILPPEITSELAGLQDEVPPEKIGSIIARIEDDFGRPVSEIFRHIEPQPLGAASLAQAHRVMLLSGEDAVVKVLRPGIEVVVETDLAAIRLAFGWLKLWKHVSERVNLDWLEKEFSDVTRKELDLESEGRNAERLARDFEDDPNVLIPSIYWDYCARRTLTSENVGFVKITDLESLKAAGIRPADVADLLHKTYMRQVFETYFVHADPHPGNLFVKPTPLDPEHPFRLVFVDFGMAVEIPERLRSALREYAIGFGTRDAHKVVQAYVHAGVILPGADTERLVQVHESLFERLWGVRSGQFRNMAMKEARFFLQEYKDVIYDTPLQFQADTLFVFRSVGMLSGLATHLDPEFDIWSKTIPFAERYAKEELRSGMREGIEELLRDGLSLGAALSRLPEEADQVLTAALRGRLTLRSSFAPDVRKSAERLEKSLNRLSWWMMSAALLVSGVMVYVSEDGILSGILFVSAFMAFWRGKG